ncbi:hypothetical protein C8J57DRAFT_1244558 [Mycena rebaudengoi]|nr:hypothetical protein C8J57DRAFT_1244558 [Mycena rebaudengoi]
MSSVTVRRWSNRWRAKKNILVESRKIKRTEQMRLQGEYRILMQRASMKNGDGKRGEGAEDVKGTHTCASGRPRHNSPHPRDQIESSGLHIRECTTQFLGCCGRNWATYTSFLVEIRKFQRVRVDGHFGVRGVSKRGYMIKNRGMVRLEVTRGSPSGGKTLGDTRWQAAQLEFANTCGTTCPCPQQRVCVGAKYCPMRYE